MGCTAALPSSVFFQTHLRVVLLLPVGGDRHTVNAFLQLSAMDVSVRSTMKGAAKCDKHCELQNSVNRQGLERILCFWDIPESMPASVSMPCCCSGCCLVRACCCDCLCLRMCAGAPEVFGLEGSAATASLPSISVCR